MVGKSKQKLYCYVDETGRDPFAPLFIVGVVLMGQKREELSPWLLEIEKESGKGIRKWKKSGRMRRQRYIEFIGREPLLKSSLYYAKYDPKGDFFAKTADAIARTLQNNKKEDLVTVFIDGFRKAELNQVKRQLKPSVYASVIVKGIKREESNPFIRLADTICGLVRDADEGIEWAVKAVARLKKKGYLQEK